ncbi:MAG: TetR/AcrR family transcriptional regulator [Granulosicoccus sp.]
MGRRSEHSREELHQLIVDATLMLVQQKGAESVTARQIAQAVGYTPGMLYSIFTNLQDIFLHVNAVGLDSLQAQCVAAQKAAKSPEDSIQSMALAYLAFAEEHTHQFNLMFRPIALAGVNTPEQLSTRIQSLFALVESELRKLDPNASDMDVSVGARALWSGVHGAAALSLTDQLYLETTHADRRIVDMMINHFVDNWQR